MSFDSSFFTEELFRELGDHIPDFLWVRDVDTGVVLYVNRGWERITGTRVPIGAHYREFFTPAHPDDREKAEQSARLFPIGGYDELLRFVHTDGTIRWMHVRTFPIRDAAGRAYRVAGVGEDVTEVQLARESLAASEQKFRALVEHSSDLIALVQPDATFRYLSPAFETVLGFPVTEWQDRPVADIIWPDDLARAATMLEENLASPGQVLHWELRLRHRDGTWRWLEGTSTNHIDDPTVGGIVINCRDVTENKRLQQQFVQAQKMESVGRLAGGVAHDFNNLLTVIQGYTSLAILELGRNDSQRATFENIQAAAESAASLTRQLLAFSRKQIIDPRVTNLNTLVKRTQRMLARLIGEDIELETFLAADLGAVRVDPSQTEQILVNLAVNARDAMPAGGKLTIETVNVRLDGTYARLHADVSEGDYVMLAVADTGSGMSDEVRQHLFEPFFTTKQPGKGTGLGLAMVYGAVKQNDGHIEVYSELGQGTAFKIYLPLVAAPEEHAPAPPLQRPAGGAEMILLVEDDDLVRQLAVRMLTRLGYTVHAFANGVAALEAIAPGDDRIRLLITDVVMPKMNGQVLAERLRALRPDVKVLFTSGYTANVIVHHGVLKEGIQFLPKPYSFDTLARRIREVLDESSA